MGDLGCQVARLGLPHPSYDRQAGRFWSAERILREAQALLHTVELNHFDVVSVHFGNLEVEQLLPQLWAHTTRPPCVYHVHSLDWTLFTAHVPDPELRAAVQEGIAAMDAFVYFGSYARDQLTSHVGSAAPSTLAWLPTTIPTRTSPAALPAGLFPDTQASPLGSLYGYAAPWKDLALLLRACRHTTRPARLLLAGPLWDEEAHTGCDLSAAVNTGVRHGATWVRVLPTYLDPAPRRGLVQASHFAVFPYRYQATFQGSGALADYLAHGRPVVATAVANLAEQVGDAGIVVPPQDPDALATALDRINGDHGSREALARRARHRAPAFTARAHATTCLRLYEQVIAHRHTA